MKREAYYQEAMLRVKSVPQPSYQKFDVGARVLVNDSFTQGRVCTVLYTYAHAFSGTDWRHYALDIDGFGYSAWYKEEQLTLV